MDDDVEDHISDGVLQEYSLETLAKPVYTKRHLLACTYCRNRLEAIEPANFVHFTEDGLVYLRATRLPTGKVMARHWGKELDGGRVCGSVSAAKSYLSESFSEMFPEHSCGGECGPAQDRGDHE